MERIIEDLAKDLIDISEGKSVKNLRKEIGDNVNIRALRMIVFGLQWASVGYQSALRLAGMKLGKKVGTLSEKTELISVLESLKQIVEVLQAGKVEIEVMPELRGARLKIYESSSAGGVANTLQRICFFEEGFIECFIDGIISKQGPLVLVTKEFTIKGVAVEEERCVGLGDDFCAFLIKFQ